MMRKRIRMKTKRKLTMNSKQLTDDDKHANHCLMGSDFGIML